MNRRSFMSAILATACAPAIVHACSLMKCSGLIVPTGHVWLPTHIEWVMFRDWHRAMWPNLVIPHTEENYRIMLQMKRYLSQEQKS